MTVSQMLRNMSSTELLYWMAYNEVENMERDGEERSRKMLDDLKAGE